MDITDRVPDPSGWFERNKIKLGGFAAGVVIPLVIMSLFTVSFRGYGFGEDPPQMRPIYTTF